MTTIDRDISFKPIDGPQREALASPADIVIYGGSNGGGKTAALVAGAARGIDDPHWTAAIFRRTYPELKQPDGVIDQAKDFYPNAAEYFNKNESKWTFPSGARIVLSGMQYESDKESWDGSQLTYIGFDQVESFTQSQFFYMLGRARSPKSSYEPHVFATCNPPDGEDHWLYGLLQWWLDADGFPMPERSGQLRYFHRDGDEIIWANGPDDLREGFEPMSLTFIPSRVDDNPYLGDSYKRRLNSLDDKTRRQKLMGQWGVEQGSHFEHAIQRKSRSELPHDLGRQVRYWDMADTDASADHADSASHTAGVLTACTRRMWTVCSWADTETREECEFWEQGKVEGVCPVCGHDTLLAKPRLVGVVLGARWFQLAADAKEARIERTAHEDGPKTLIGIEQEGGSSGKDAARYWQRDVLDGYDVQLDRPTGDKQSRASLWRSMAQQGRLWVVDAPWASDYIRALERQEPMDVVDATSGSFKLSTDQLHEASGQVEADHTLVTGGQIPNPMG